MNELNKMSSRNEYNDTISYSNDVYEAPGGQNPPHCNVFIRSIALIDDKLESRKRKEKRKKRRKKKFLPICERSAGFRRTTSYPSSDTRPFAGLINTRSPSYAGRHQSEEPGSTMDKPSRTNGRGSRSPATPLSRHSPMRTKSL